MQELIFLVGLPGSGKSSWAREKNRNGEYTVYSSEEYKKEYAGNTAVYAEIEKRIRKDLKAGKSCILDACNLSRRRRMKMLSMTGKNVRRKCVILLTSMDICAERADCSMKLINRLLRRMDLPCYFEGFDEIEPVVTGEPYVFPFEEAMKMDQENPYHHLTVGEHIQAVYEYAVKKRFGKEIETAALNHDIGKFYTKDFYDWHGQYTPGRAHFYGHEHYGAYLYLMGAMGRGDEFEYALYIAALIDWHMVALYEWGDNEIRRRKDRKLIGDKMYSDILKLHEADMGGK